MPSTHLACRSGLTRGGQLPTRPEQGEEEALDAYPIELEIASQAAFALESGVLVDFPRCPVLQRAGHFDAWTDEIP